MRACSGRKPKGACESRYPRLSQLPDRQGRETSMTAPNEDEKPVVMTALPEGAMPAEILFPTPMDECVTNHIVGADTTEKGMGSPHVRPESAVGSHACWPATKPSPWTPAFDCPP